MRDTFVKHNTRKSDISIDYYNYLLGMKKELVAMKETHESVAGSATMVSYHLRKAIEYLDRSMHEIIERSMEGCEK